MPLAMVVVANGRLWRSITWRSSSGLAIRIADEPSTAIGRLALAISSPALAMAASGAGRSVDSAFIGAAVASRAGASATSSGRSRCTGPRGSLMARRIASFTVCGDLARSPGGTCALVIGLNSAWWSIHIWMRRPSWSVFRLQVMAIIGERSSQALPTPVARLVAPGPSVAMQSPGAPVSRPVTSAAKPAEPSCAVSTKSTPPLRIASISGSTLPLGMPKPRRMPAALRVATIRSALFTFGVLRRSFTRTALPCERGTSPGALTSTAQVTPIRDLMWCADLGRALVARRVVVEAPGAISTSTVMASSAPSRVSTS